MYDVWRFRAGRSTAGLLILWTSYFCHRVNISLLFLLVASLQLTSTIDGSTHKTFTDDEFW